MKSRDGVLRTGHLGWESLPWSAKRSASLFPRMSTWDGTLINLMEPVCVLRVSRRSSQRGTFETGPLLPVHPLSFHRRAAPVAPRKTYSLSVQIAILPKVKICNARITARTRGGGRGWGGGGSHTMTGPGCPPPPPCAPSLQSGRGAKSEVAPKRLGGYMTAGIWGVPNASQEGTQ